MDRSEQPGSGWIAEAMDGSRSVCNDYNNGMISNDERDG
jgi:hypothetical protein